MGIFQGLLEASPDAVLVVDEKGVIQRANRNVSAVLGYSPTELEGKVVEELLLEEDREHHVEFRQDYIADPEPRPMGRGLDLYALNKDGTEIPVEISLGPVEQNGDRYVVATVTDITERKARERELQARALAMETSIDGMAILDSNGEYIFVNQAHAHVYGYDDPDAFLGETWQLCYGEDELARFEADVMPTLFEEGAWRGEAVGTRKDGSTFPQELSLTVTGNDGIVCVVRDITERKQREEELHRQNERLERFADTVSHDLRNPLNVAAGRLKLAQQECESDHLDDVERAHTRMEELIEDLLTLAREGERVDEMESVALAETVKQCWRNVSAPEATLELEADQLIQADQSRLRQLLENLMRNAVEHGGTDVTVTVGVSADGFYLEDDGTGIPEAQRADIFENGYSTTQDGTGFGLNIVAQIAEAHDWSVHITEGETGGARFEITGVKHCQ